MLYIGADLGTSAVKLLLMESDGTIRNIVSREYPLYFPHPGWSEQAPEDWLAQSLAGISNARRSAVSGCILFSAVLQRDPRPVQVSGFA